jgi:hypothetical protein
MARRFSTLALGGWTRARPPRCERWEIPPSAGSFAMRCCPGRGAHTESRLFHSKPVSAPAPDKSPPRMAGRARQLHADVPEGAVVMVEDAGVFAAIEPSTSTTQSSSRSPRNLKIVPATVCAVTSRSSNRIFPPAILRAARSSMTEEPHRWPGPASPWRGSD